MEDEIRGARVDELPAVAALVNRVFRPNGGHMPAEYPLMFAPENAENLRIAVHDGVPVAHVGVCMRSAVIMGGPVGVASIGAVCTDPAHRGRGLATRLMADVRRHAREHGASLVLISGGRGLYHRLGYVTVGSFDRYGWTAAELEPAQDSTIDVAPYRPADLPEVVALHQREPVRFLRSETDWQKLLAAGMLMNSPAELWLVRQQGVAVAYLSGSLTSGRHVKAPPELQIREFGGSRNATTAALAVLLQSTGAASATLATPAGDPELSVLAHQHGWLPRSISFPGTIGIVDGPGLIDSLRPILSERAEPVVEARASGDKVMLTVAGEAYSIEAPGPLAALVFGGDTAEAAAVPPAPPRVKAHLTQLFPLPLLWQGYNYV
jgi:predicted N-acetyltransferase YhbS